MTVTLLIAIWGAVVSTALAIRTIWRDRFEDGRLRVGVWVGRASGSNYIKPFCTFDVVNVGRRPVYFGGLVLHDKEGKFIAQPLGPEPEGYIKLEPGEVCETPMMATFDDVGHILRIRRIYAIDTRRGRIYVPRWRVWRMHREVQKILTEHARISLTAKQST